MNEFLNNVTKNVSTVTIQIFKDSCKNILYLLKVAKQSRT